MPKVLGNADLVFVPIVLPSQKVKREPFHIINLVSLVGELGSHMPQNNWAHVLQLESLQAQTAGARTLEATRHNPELLRALDPRDHGWRTCALQQNTSQRHKEDPVCHSWNPMQPNKHINIFKSEIKFSMKCSYQWSLWLLGLSIEIFPAWSSMLFFLLLSPW